jgi:carbon-monoxide dehydrogenase medium subunit
VIPLQFEYVAFNSIEESIKQLKENDKAKIIAGGQSLLTNMNLKYLTPSMLVDLRKISALHELRYVDGGLHIGAMVTYDKVAASKDVQLYYPALAEAVQLIGDSQVRNRGTIGGNLAYNNPASDLPAVVLALEAKFKIVGSYGTRTVSADEFFIGPFKTVLCPDEIITSINFPAYPAGTGSAYKKIKNSASGFAICGIAALVELSANKTVVNKCRLAVTGAADYAMRLKEVEILFEGKEATSENIAVAASSVNKVGLNFVADFYASAEYRSHLAQVLIERAIASAVERAR